MRKVRVRPGLIQSLRAPEAIVMSGILQTWCLLGQARDLTADSEEFDRN